MNKKIYLNDQWLFVEKFTDDFWKETNADAVQVRIPHTCKETPLHYFSEEVYQMVSGYVRHLFVEREWEGRKLLLTFLGVAHRATVYVNGEEVGSHSCGYTAFTFDISQAVRYGGDNTIVVKVNSTEQQNIPPFGYVIDYMTYGGIYRDVYLEVKEPVGMEQVLIQPEFEPEFTSGELDDHKGRKGAGRLVCELDFYEKAEQRMILIYLKKCENHTLPDENRWEESDEPLLILDACDGKVIAEKHLSQICGWDIDNPNRYQLRIVVYVHGIPVETYEEIIGFRKSEFRKDGYYLNNKKIKIRGLNRHQSFPYVGYAMPKSMQMLDANLLKQELGVNAVRTSHYPQSKDFIYRCDELGLLVFTEMPGWQHIGGEAWKKQALLNLEEMVVQYRNHPSIILWGVRINESEDDDAFYEQTNALCHRLDHTRPTGGVRANKKSHLLEDVYTYNDFSHSGRNEGVLAKKKVTSDRNQPYLVSEYNGHMFPTKSFDDEEHRREQMIRHANVLEGIAGHSDIAGGFGWCMFDYNTHQDFGSGDRICYHGVMDMFRNRKYAGILYGCQSEQEDVLEVCSSMDIGEHPACNRGETYILTNADEVRMYKNDVLIHQYYREDSKYKHLSHGPILITDYVGNQMGKEEGFTKKQEQLVKDILNYVAQNGMEHLPFSIMRKAVILVLLYHMSPDCAVRLYNKYVGDWGQSSKVYRFEGVTHGEVVTTRTKAVMKTIHLQTQVSHRILTEQETYDVALIRIQAVDENQNVLPYYMEPVHIRSEGPIEVIGPKSITLYGGMGGVYVKTTGETGAAKVILQSNQTKEIVIDLVCEKK